MEGILLYISTDTAPDLFKNKISFVTLLIQKLQKRPVSTFEKLTSINKECTRPINLHYYSFTHSLELSGNELGFRTIQVKVINEDYDSLKYFNMDD